MYIFAHFYIALFVHSYIIFNNFSDFNYLKNKFKIKFENKDCSIIENSYDEYLPCDKSGSIINVI